MRKISHVSSPASAIEVCLLVVTGSDLTSDSTDFFCADSRYVFFSSENDFFGANDDFSAGIFWIFFSSSMFEVNAIKSLASEKGGFTSVNFERSLMRVGVGDFMIVPINSSVIISALVFFEKSWLSFSETEVRFFSSYDVSKSLMSSDSGRPRQFRTSSLVISFFEMMEI